MKWKRPTAIGCKQWKIDNGKLTIKRAVNLNEIITFIL